MAIKGKIHNNTIIVGNFTNPFTSMDKPSIQKNKIMGLSVTSDEIDLIDPHTAEYTHFQTHMEHSPGSHITGLQKVSPFSTSSPALVVC